MRFAVRERIIDRAPSIQRPAKPTPTERSLEKEDTAALIDAAASPHIALAIHVLFATAGRVGAVLDLTWDRLDFQRAIINLRVYDAKTRKARAIVPMNAGIRAALQTAHDAALSDYIIEYAGGNRKGFEAVRRRAQLDSVTLHTIRHSSAVAMVSNGVTLEKVAQYLGHSNVAIIYQTYARFTPDHLQDAVEILDFVQIGGGALIRPAGSASQGALGQNMLRH